MKSLGATFLPSLVLAFSVGSTPVLADSISTAIAQSASAEHRSPKNIARNQFRNPVETLSFFGLQQDMSVVEIWPGGGWYSEILAPVLKDYGKYYAAGFSLVAKRTPDWRKNYQKKYEAKLQKNPDVYGNTIITDLSIPERPEIAPAGSADLVLTFRNVHNWMKGKYARDVFNSMYKALKPKGILGVVEHIAKSGTILDDMITSG
jgi:predicted methyltransferase